MTPFLLLFDSADTATTGFWVTEKQDIFKFVWHCFSVMFTVYPTWKGLSISITEIITIFILKITFIGTEETTLTIAGIRNHFRPQRLKLSAKWQCWLKYDPKCQKYGGIWINFHFNRTKSLRNTVQWLKFVILSVSTNAMLRFWK